MIRHLLKLVWNMKRANALVILEIFVSFLVLFAVTTGLLYFANLYGHPLGFAWKGVWNVSIDMKVRGDDEWNDEMVTRFESILRELSRMPEVESAAGLMMPPYSFGEMRWGIEMNGKTVWSGFDEATDGLDRVLRMKLVEGRWFSAEDDAATYRPIVINERAAREMFGSESAIGKLVPLSKKYETRVVGVVKDFRSGGEFSSLQNFMFKRVRVGDVTTRPPRNIVIRVRPGTTVAFEEELSRRLEGIAPNWSFAIKPLSDSRELGLRLAMAPIIVGATIALFLILMVALGLTGVMWQNVTRRTREIGLRRAVGAPAAGVYRQILAENAVITTIGLLLGGVLVAQIPLLGNFAFLEAKLIAASLVLSFVLIYAITTACGFYPSWMASRIEPAEALHYE